MNVTPNDVALRRALEAANRALALDSSYAPAWGRLAFVATMKRDLEGSARYLERAQALAPTDPAVLTSSAMLLQALGRNEQAFEIRRYLALRDPVNPSVLFNLGTATRWAGDYDEAIVQVRRALTLNPGMGSAHYHVGVCLLLKGDGPEALAEMQQEGSDIWRLFGLALAYHAMGRQAQSDSALDATIRKYPRDAPYNIAYIYAFRGQADSAFVWLDRAAQYSDPGLSEIVVENLFDRIHADPRWLAFLRRIGRAPEQVEHIPFHVDLPRAGGAGKVAMSWRPPDGPARRRSDPELARRESLPQG